MGLSERFLQVERGYAISCLRGDVDFFPYTLIPMQGQIRGLRAEGSRALDQWIFRANANVRFVQKKKKLEPKSEADSLLHGARIP